MFTEHSSNNIAIISRLDIEDIQEQAIQQLIKPIQDAVHPSADIARTILAFAIDLKC